MGELREGDGWDLPGYRVGRLIGRGGFSAVYEAQQLSLGRTVAVKVLLTDLASAADRRRFEREREILARLSEHPSIVDVHDAGISAERRPFIVMRLYGRGTLAARVAEQGPLDLDQVVSVVGKLASALDAAHALGVLHRDVKPENVLVADDGSPVLSDFGIAALVDPDGTSTSHTSTKFFTLAHVAPEVLERSTFTVASDVYALASTAYLLLSGTLPFDVSNPRVAAMILDDAPPPLTRPGLPDAVGEVIAAGLAKDPADRPASAGAFADALAAALAKPPSDVEPVDSADVADAALAATVAASVISSAPEPAPPARDEPAPAPPAREPFVIESREDLAVLSPTQAGGALPAPSLAPSSSPVPGAPKAATSGRRRQAIVAAAVALVTVVGGGGLVWAQSRYEVGVRAGKIAVFKGLGSGPKSVSDVDVELLPVAEQAWARGGISVSGRKAADDLVARFRTEATQCQASMQPPCPARTPAFPAVSARPSTFPNGNKVTITWNAPDSRVGVSTALRVNGAAPPSGCPTVITAAGRCSFTGRYGQTYEVKAEVTVPGREPVSQSPVTATTYVKPTLAVIPGAKTWDSSGVRYCRVTITATGLRPNTLYVVGYYSAQHEREGWNAERLTAHKATDARGNLTGIEVGDDAGYRDPQNNGWVRVTVGTLTATRSPWGCT